MVDVAACDVVRTSVPAYKMLPANVEIFRCRSAR